MSSVILHTSDFGIITDWHFSSTTNVGLTHACPINYMAPCRSLVNCFFDSCLLQCLNLCTFSFQPQDVAKLLEKIIPHKFSLQLSIYYVCLQLYTVSRNVQEISLKQQPYLHSPSNLVDHVTSNVKSDWPTGCQLLLELLHHYRELLADHTQAEVLQNLGLGNVVLISWSCFHAIAWCLSDVECVGLLWWLVKRLNLAYILAFDSNGWVLKWDICLGRPDVHTDHSILNSAELA